MHSSRFRIHPTSVEGSIFLVSSVLLAIYSWVLHVASHAAWKMSPYLFPLVIAAFLFVLSLSLLQEGRKERQNLALQEQKEEPFEKINDIQENTAIKTMHDNVLFVTLKHKSWYDAAVFALIALLYIMSIALIGFIVATVLFLATSFVYLKERRIWLVLLLSCIFPLIVYVLFGMLLHVMLP